MSKSFSRLPLKWKILLGGQGLISIYIISKRYMTRNNLIECKKKEEELKLATTINVKEVK
jgi:hypothetical protein